MDITSRLKSTWNFLKNKPGGKKVFSFLLGRLVPYSGSVSPYIDQLDPGHCRVYIKERPGIRNHLKSVHALALANVGEMASGLAMMSQLESSHQAIVTGLSIEYVKKARGRIMAESKVTLPPLTDELKLQVESLLYDEKGDIVAKMKVAWLIRVKQKRIAS